MMGANVDLATAKATAQQYAASKMANGKQMAPSAIDLKLVKQEMNSNKPGTAVYYIFNTDDHFIIISGDDRAPEVLAYGDRPLDEKRIPANMGHWLANYKGQMEYLQEHP
ncbi:MAG: Spi family protease inhibitor, partial [Muribaculaceae bacterium]|nr:Spi family protease inhibitor [Muribaculaceae bacterium]